MCDHPPTRSKSLGIANLRSLPNSVIYTLFTEAACAQLSTRMLPWVDAGPWLRAAADITNTNRIPSPTDNTLPNVANTRTHPRTRETVDTRGRSFVHDSFFLHTHKDRNTHIHSQMQDEKKKCNKYQRSTCWLTREQHLHCECMSSHTWTHICEERCKNTRAIICYTSWRQVFV